MASTAAKGRPPLPGPPAVDALPDDIRKLQAEILTGLDSDEEDGEEALAAPGDDSTVELTKAVVLRATGEHNLDDVTQLIFRDQQLRCLSTPRSIDLESLVNLEVLSLSHNLLEDIEPLAMLVALVEVNLNFNRIADLSPLFDCESLEKLFAAHNEVDSVEGLDTGCPKLRELSLYANSLEDHDEVMQTLVGLPDLCELHIGANACCAAPSQRYKLLSGLPSLQVFDGQKVNSSDRKFAVAFLDAASRDEAPDEDDMQAPDNVPRPVTAPSVCARPRPPLAPSNNNTSVSATLAPFAPLPGQKLLSSKANRIDDLLTQSRDPSPEISESRIPMLDMQSIDMSEPDRALVLLTAHRAALQQWLDTMQIDRENLRFQVRLLEQDNVAQQIDQLQADVDRLEVENRSSQAVQSEHAQLQTKLAEVEKKLTVRSQKSRAQGAETAARQDELEDDETISQLRWENSLLEKRLDRMKKYSDQSRHNFLSAQVKSRQSSSHGSGASKAEDKVDDTVDPELRSMLADNEAMLRRLHGDVSQTASGKPPHSSVHAGLKKHVKHAQVDVLTLASEGSEDVEYHGKV